MRETIGQVYAPPLHLRSTHSESVIFVQGVRAKTGPNNPHTTNHKRPAQSTLLCRDIPELCMRPYWIMSQLVSTEKMT